MRHAQAVSSAASGRDFDRTLSDQGYAQAELVADKAIDLGYTPDCLVSSTAIRCRQTAEIVRRSVSESLDIEFVDALYNSTPETYATIIAGQSSNTSVMLVGHNPTIDQLLEGLIGSAARRSALVGGYPTAGIAVLDHAPDRAEEGFDWILHDFVKP
ncbi:SixA phosphatase family protein [Aliirhizobium terrae]|uniref:SixA phosphatase family protein n=1 Tax=Terrirhizobium terrae TaxID=2926709 RepID=UPI0035B5161E